MNVTNGTKWLLRRFGFQLSHWPRIGTLEGDLERVLKTRSISTVLDVGANTGQFARLLRSTRFSGAIHSFEPSPGPFSALMGTIDETWHRHNFALGAETDEIELLRFAESRLDSFHHPSRIGTGAMWAMEPTGTAMVPVRKLDDVALELGLQGSGTLLKLDTQGHDLEVLAGAKTLASEITSLLVEMPIRNLYENAPSFEQILSTVLDLSLEPVGFYSAAKWREDSLLVLEFDGLFVRR